MKFGEIEFTEIPVGEFVMGALDDDKFADNSERPARLVTIPKPFQLSTTVITNKQWSSIMDTTEADDFPRTKVSYKDTVRFTETLSKQLNRTFRLPTEEEWEYAARANSSAVFSGSSSLELSDANYFYSEAGNRVGEGRIMPVGSYPPNEFGLYEMLGNVAEWTRTEWSRTDDGTIIRVIRGGAWDHMPRLLRCSCRDYAPESTRQDNLGFRLLSPI